MEPRHEFVYSPILESWPLVPVEQDANLKHLLEDPDYWRDDENSTPVRRTVAPTIAPSWQPRIFAAAKLPNADSENGEIGVKMTREPSLRPAGGTFAS